MRKTKSSTARSKKKLPKKTTRKISSVKVKKVRKKKVVKVRKLKKPITKKKKKKVVKKPRVSKFEVEKKDEFIMETDNDTPIINFQPNFLIGQTDVDELLDQVEINEQDSILIEEPEQIEVDHEQNDELEKLIKQDNVLAESTIGDSNYNLKMREDNIAVKRSKKIQKKSQHLINLRDKLKSESHQPVLESPALNIIQKKTIKNLSSSYLRELSLLGSKTKFFKFSHFLGKNLSVYCSYLALIIQIGFKFLVNVFFSILVSLNNLGEKIYKGIESMGQEKELKSATNTSIKSKINTWREKVLDFNPILVFKRSTVRTYSKVLTFLLICLLIISSIQVMALVGKFNFSKGKILGISEQALGEFNAGLKSMASSDFNSAQDNFDQANQKFVAAEEEISKYNNLFVEILKFIPREGKKLDYGLKFLNAGRLFSEAAEHISLALEQQNKEITLTDKISLIANNLNQSKDKLQQVSKDITELDLDILPEEYRDKFTSIQKNLPILISNLEDLDSVSEVILDILGVDGPKRYLLLFQNSNELRPTGGFMGSLAILDIKEGSVEKVKVPEGGPYDLKASFFENIESPDILKLVNPNLNLWDANWFADFPTSAELILKYWEKSGGSTVDGVITINSDVMIKFLEIIGPIELEERGIEMNADNFIRQTQEIVEIQDAGSTPKAVIGEMMSKILDKVFKDQELDYLKTLKLFNTSVGNKDIQVYFPDASLESTISNYGWGGSMQDTSGDYLAVINTNIGGAKTDEFIYETQNHSVQILANGTIIDTLKIDRNFIAEIDNPFSQDTNRTYLRIYVPQGVKLLEVSGFEEFPEDEYMVPVVGSKEDENIKEIQGRFVIDEISGVRINNEFNKTVFSGWQELEPGQKKRITLKYELPFKLNLDQDISLLDKFFKKDDHLNLDTYTVVYEKQSGKDAELNLDYNWSESLDLVWSNIPDNSLEISLDKNRVIGFILEK